jgi:hypothetical protein
VVRLQRIEVEFQGYFRAVYPSCSGYWTMTDLSHLGELTKPATVLVEKISDAVGGVFKPFQIVRVAKAEAEADRIRAESQIQVTDLHRRAMLRFFEEEAKKQTNIEEITKKALPLLEEKSAPERMENDWITNFFDKCRIVSNQDMQQIWARILAGEANKLGTFAKRTVNLVGDFDRRDAILFTSLCGFVWSIQNSRAPLVFDTKAEIYTSRELNFGSLSHLASIGLIVFAESSLLKRRNLGKKAVASYHGRKVVLTLPNDAGNEVEIGKVMLTIAGHELCSICEPKPVDEFYDYVYGIWEGKALVPKRESPDSSEG